MNNINNSQKSTSSNRQSGIGKWIITLGIIAVLVMLIVVIVLGGYIYMTGQAASQSEIFIRSPQDGEQVIAGESVQVHALARDDQKIVRFELWVDGKLVDAQTSSTPGGINPFPLLTTWYPEVGTHTLIARSFNSRKATAQATITVEAVALHDRDSDTVADETDACPDVAGNPAADGCPDRDFDGIADEHDTCPDVAGMPEDGCPAPTEVDSDGDGTHDSADICPDVPGSPLAEGCPDGDSDGTPDVSDACPSEPGTIEGCPDTSGGGAPAESGEGESSEEAGGVPPEGGEGSDEESVPGEHETFGEGGGWEAVDLVRLEALNFSVTQDYDQIFCYAGVVSRDIEQYGPFDSLGHHEWDIVAYMGGENTRTLGVEVGQALELHVECNGRRGDLESFDLGSFTRTYDSSQWDGHVIEEISGAREEERGDPGHSFDVQFRLCLRSCDSADFPPPSLRQYEETIGPWSVNFLSWHWDGDRHNISGYRLYINGHHRETIRDVDATRINQRDYMPPCGERYEYSLTAYYRNGAEFRESPPSNSVFKTGEECPRRVKVIYEQLEVSGYEGLSRGPLYGSFVATGSETKSLNFDGGSCTGFLWIFACDGIHMRNFTTTISALFNDIRAFHESCSGYGCREAHAPSVDYLLIELDEGDDLTIGGSIWEEQYWDDERLFHDNYSIGPDVPLPYEYTLRDENRRGNFAVRVRVEEFD